MKKNQNVLKRKLKRKQKKLEKLKIEEKKIIDNLEFLTFDCKICKTVFHFENKFDRLTFMEKHLVKCFKRNSKNCKIIDKLAEEQKREFKYNFKCSLCDCNINFESEEDRDKFHSSHFFTEHANPDKKIVKKTPKYPFHCELCNKTFEFDSIQLKVKFINLHVKHEHSTDWKTWKATKNQVSKKNIKCEKFICAHCDFTCKLYKDDYKNDKQLFIHYMEKHPSLLDLLTKNYYFVRCIFDFNKHI